MGDVGSGTNARPEETLTIAASCRCFSMGRNVATIRIGPMRLISISRVRSSSESTGLWRFTVRMIPALLTRTLSSGKSFATVAWRDWMSFAWPASLRIVFRPGIACSAFVSFAWSRPVMTTLFPSSVSALARWKPMPLAPPVIRIVLPFRFIAVSLCLRPGAILSRGAAVKRGRRARVLYRGRLLFDAHTHLLPDRLALAIRSFVSRAVPSLPYPPTAVEARAALVHAGVQRCVSLPYAHKGGISAALNRDLAERWRGDPMVI